MSTSEKLFVDTNIFIYTLFEIDKKKHSRCVALFEKANRGEVKLWTTEWVIAELVWFLTKQKFNWDKTKDTVTKILVTRGLETYGKKLLLEVLDLCNKNIDFVDAINITLALYEDIKRGYSYDKGLSRWKEFKRLEP